MSINTTCMFGRTAVAALALGLIVIHRAPAAPVAVLNPGFETPAYADYAYGVVSNWVGYDPTGSGMIGNGANFGAYNPPAAAYPNGIPGGNNVGWVWNVTGVEIGMQQTLAATVAHDTRYTLTVMVCDPKDYGGFGLAGFPGYEVELVADAGGADTVLAADSNTLSIVEGSFEQSTITYTSPSSGPVLGKALTIRLICFSGTGVEVDFDNVALDATPVGAASGFRITNIQRHANGDIMLAWNSRSNVTYSILGSDAPRDFTPIVTNIPSAGDSTIATFQDPAAIGGKLVRSRFYIVEENP